MRPAGRAAILLALVLAPASGDARPAEEQAKVVLVDSEFDLGVAAVSEENVAHEFTFRNAGQKVLTLENAVCSRGGRIASWDRTLPPGAEGRVRVEVNTREAYGPTQLLVSVLTNDPSSPRVDFKLKVEVRPFVLVRPGYARYIFVQGAAPGTIHEFLWATDGQPFRILSATSPYPFIRVEPREVKPAERDPAVQGPEVGLDVTILSNPPVGTLGAEILVRVDHPRQKEVRIPLTGFVRPMFAVTPAEARLGPIDANTPFEARFFVRNFATEPVELLGVSSDVAGVTGDFKEVDPGHGFDLRLKLDPHVMTGPFQGTVRIKTSSPKQPTVELLLSGEVRAATSPRP